MKILIVYYSLYGHVFKLAQAVKEGAESVKGAEVLFRRVEEFDIVLKKTADDKYLSQVREQQKDIPVCTLDDLRAADGVIIGSDRKILIVYYSLYGHVFKLAQAVKEGAESVKGAEVLFRRVEEFDIVLKKTADDKYLSQVREQQKDIPVCTLDDLRAADGVIIGSPTRYGNMTAQMKQLIDSTASLWLKGEMEGKPAGVFTCTASTHGGQETTLVTMMIPLLHLGMLIVGVPY